MFFNNSLPKELKNFPLDSKDPVSVKTYLNQVFCTSWVDHRLNQYGVDNIYSIFNPVYCAVKENNYDEAKRLLSMMIGDKLSDSAECTKFGRIIMGMFKQLEKLTPAFQEGCIEAMRQYSNNLKTNFLKMKIKEPKRQSKYVSAKRIVDILNKNYVDLIHTPFEGDSAWTHKDSCISCLVEGLCVWIEYFEKFNLTVAMSMMEFTKF